MQKYYRTYSIPQRSDPPRGIFARAREAMNGPPPGASATPREQHAHTQQVPPYTPRPRTNSHPSSFPRPDLEDHAPRPSRPSTSQHAPPPRPPPQQHQQSYQQQQQYHQQHQQQQRQNYYTYGQAGAYAYNAPPPQGYHSFAYQPRTTPRNQYNPPPGAPPGQQPRNSNTSTPGPGSRPRSASASAPRTPTPNTSTRPASPSTSTPSNAAAVPTLDELLELPAERLSALSIGTLKAVLFRNHVPTGLVVEKAELVERVARLVEDERAERAAARRRAEEEEEEARERERADVLEAIERSRREAEEREAQEGARDRSEGVEQREESAAGEQAEGGAEPSTSSSTQHDRPATPHRDDKDASAAPRGKLTPKAQAMASHLERTGLCVICQDEEANIAIVDCGCVVFFLSCCVLVWC